MDMNRLNIGIPIYCYRRSNQLSRILLTYLLPLKGGIQSLILIRNFLVFLGYTLQKGFQFLSIFVV